MKKKIDGNKKRTHAVARQETPPMEFLPKFTASKYERTLIAAIVKRVVKHAKKYGIPYDAKDASMDLEACHCNGCSLDLERLRDAPDADFGHDVYGIRRFLNRSTGKLVGMFDPRCALPE